MLLTTHRNAHGGKSRSPEATPFDRECLVMLARHLRNQEIDRLLTAVGRKLGRLGRTDSLNAKSHLPSGTAS